MEARTIRSLLGRCRLETVQHIVGVGTEEQPSIGGSWRCAGTRRKAQALPEDVPRIGLVAVALTLPVLAGVVLLFVTSFGLALAISATTVLVSSILVAIDARRLEKVDLMGRQRESAGILFLGMCLLWIIVYPLAFFRRRHFGGPNLGTDLYPIGT